MCECEHKKATPRSEELKKQLKTRMNRVIGQLNGMLAMLEEDRYCGDVLIQLAAAEKALQGIGYLILEDHMNTCVAEKVKAGDPAALAELLELMKKLK